MAIRNGSLRILVAGVVALVAATTFTACSADQDGPADPNGSSREITTSQDVKLTVEKNDEILKMFPESVQESGKLRLAVDPSYPPSAFKDADDKIIGFGPDLASVVAATAGLQIEWTEVPFDGMLGGLQAGRFDAAWAGFSVTPERLEVINMVTYIAGGSTVLVAKGNPEHIEADTDLCGTVVAVQKGTIQAQDVMKELQASCSTAGKDPVKPLELQLQTDVAQAIDAGRAGSGLGDGANISYLALQEPDRFETIPGILLKPVNAAIAVPLKETDTAKALQATFNAMIKDGSYAEILDSWKLTSMALPESVLNPSM